MRNGYLPERDVLPAAGPVAVKVPNVRDRSGTGVKFHSMEVLPYVRKSPRVLAALPVTDYVPGLAFKLMEEAEKSWRKIRGADRIKSLLDCVLFKDSLPAPDNPPEQQKLAA